MNLVDRTHMVAARRWRKDHDQMTSSNVSLDKVAMQVEMVAYGQSSMVA